MNVSDILDKDFRAVPDRASLRQAAALMREEQAEVLVVIEGDRTVGTLSQRDLALAGYGEGRDPDEDFVDSVMTRHLVSCPLDTELITALRLMTEQDVDALVLGEPPDRIIGLVTRVRVLEELADPATESRGPVLEEVKRVRGNPF